MIEEETLLLFLVLLVGVTVILAILIKAALERMGIPPLVGYLMLGIAIGKRATIGRLGSISTSFYQYDFGLGNNLYCFTFIVASITGKVASSRSKRIIPL